jgi:HK97 family phage major capsid protein
LRQRAVEVEAKIAVVIAAQQTILDTATAEKRDLTQLEADQFAKNTEAMKPLRAEMERNTFMLFEIGAQLQREKDMKGIAVGDAPNGRAAARDNANANGGFKSFGEQLVAVSRAARGGRVDPRLSALGDFDGQGNFKAAGGSDGAMNEGVPSEGGFLVGADYAQTVYQRTYRTGNILSRCTRVPITATSNKLKLRVVDEDSRADGSRMGGVLALWENEADAYIYSRGKFRQVELNLHKLTGLMYATDELLDDAPALEAWIMQNLPTELRFRTEDAIFQGSGAGQPLGIFNTQALLTVNGGTTTAALSVADVLQMWAQFYYSGAQGSIAAEVADQNLLASKDGSAAWFIDQSVLPYLFQLQVGTGTGPGVVLLYHPPGSNPLYGTYGDLLGLPVIPTEHNMNYGTAGDILLADLSQYLIADKGSIAAAASMHVRFVYDEMTFRFTYRVDGQTIWKKPLTPKSGGNTLSPFVVCTGGNFR